VLVVLAACAEPAPSAPPPPAAPPAPPPLLERTVTVRPRDTLGGVVQAAALPEVTRLALLSALGKALDARKVRPGQALALFEDGQGTLARAEWRAGPFEVLELQPAGHGFEARWREYAFETAPARVAVTVESSLFEAFLAAGEDPALAVAASDVLAWEVDFYRDVRPGDRLELVVEKTTCGGEFVRWGELLAVRWRGAGGDREFLRWSRAGTPGWYAPDGRSARRAFLKQPLPLVRITSGFGRRHHPVLGYFKQHEGVDYGAPTGTPVWSVGEGVVTWAGPKGPNGLLVSVRHANGYSSHYAHLSKIAVRNGASVSQKQVIGRVGASGRATGPHLHFALSRRGAFVNPLSQRSPAGEPLGRAELATFSTATRAARLLLDAPAMVVASIER
jgi:murein DD-endopeptidase MepM/ murein hydrolase activator NlpD